MSKRGGLRFEIENFGPIAAGSFELRPLTLFIGPNNSGKSYAAMLAHSIVRTMPAKGIPAPIFYGVHRKNKAATIQDIFDWFFSSDDFKKEMIRRIQNYFSCEDLEDLVFRLALEDKVRIRIYGCGSKDWVISIEGQGSQWTVRGKAPTLPELEGHPQTLLPGWDRPRQMEGIPLDELWRAWNLLGEALGLPEMSYYLPAARSGVLQGWRVLTAEAVRQVSRWAGIREIEVPRFPGLIGEFLAHLIDASEHGRGPRRWPPRARGAALSKLQSALEVLEGDLLKGKVDFSFANGELVPEIVYQVRAKRKKIEIPIRRASSTVGELAPLVLWIKHLLEPGDMLIIEEPEAHLHPENQRRVARALVRLARSGVTVLCTTHSSLILHQVSNHLLAAQADPKRRAALGFTEEDLLSEDEVGVYLFHIREDGRGSEIQPLRIEPGFGIPEDEFVRVSEAIGEETYRLTGPLTVELGEE